MPAAADAQEKITYQDHVLPIFRNACLSCHNPEKKKAGLDLSTYAGTIAGSDNGKVLEAGDPDGSQLYRVVMRTEEPFMPPKGDKLPEKDLEILKKFIAGGLLETSSSSAVVSNKPKLDLKVTVSAGKPDGPPPMPGPLVLEPILKAQRAGAVLAMGASPWSPLVAIGAPKQILLYNTQTLDLLGVLAFPEGEPFVLKFSRSGKLLLAGGGVGAKTGRIVLYDITTGSRVTELGDEFDAVLAADLTADQAHVALGGPSKLVKIFNTATGAAIKTIKKHTDWVTAVGYSPDGVLLASGDRNGGLFVWEGATGGEFYALNGHKSAITSVAFRGDSNVLASSSEDGTVMLWNMSDGNRIREFRPNGNTGVLSVSFSADGRLTTATRDGSVRVFGPDGNLLKEMDPKFGDIALTAVFDGTGERVIGGDWTGAIRVWTAADGKAAGELTGIPPSLEERINTAAKRAADLTPAADAALAMAKTAEEGATRAAAEVVAAEENVVKTKQAMDVVQAQATEAEGAMQRATAAMNNAVQAVPAVETAMRQATELAAQTKAAFEQVERQHNESKATVTAKEAELAAAQKAAAEKAAAAAADANQANAATEAKAVETRIAAELAELQKQFAVKTEELKVATETRDKAQAAMAPAEVAMKTAKDSVEAMTAARGTADATLKAMQAAFEVARVAATEAPKQIEPKKAAAKVSAEMLAQAKAAAEAAANQVALAKHEQGRFRAAQRFAVLYGAQQELIVRTAERDNGAPMIDGAQKAAAQAQANVANVEKVIAEGPQRLAAAEANATEARLMVKPAFDDTQVAASVIPQREQQMQQLTEQAMKSRAAADREKDKPELVAAAEMDKVAADTLGAELNKFRADAAKATEEYKAALAEVTSAEVAITKEKADQANAPKKLETLKQLAATAAADIPKVQQAAAEAPAKVAAAQAKVDQLKAEYEQLLKEVPPPPAIVAATPPAK